MSSYLELSDPPGPIARCAALWCLWAGLMIPGCRLPDRYRTVDTNETASSAAYAVVLDQETIEHEQHNLGTGHSGPLASPSVHRARLIPSVSPETLVSNRPFDPSLAQSPTASPKNDRRSEFSQQLHQSLRGPPPALNFRDDAHNMWGTLIDDSKGLVDWKNTAILGLAAGAVIGVHQDWDGKVRDYTAKRPNQWGNTGKSIGRLGNFPVQIPALLGLYSYSLWDQNEPLHDLSGTLMSAYAITATTTVFLKVAANTDRPSDNVNNGRFGFPSYHASSSFAIASVLDEYYGPKIGLPAYVLAGAIGWTRIDTRAHDLSDVIFGAVLGTVIGKGVARQHLGRGVDVMPYYDPQSNATGVTIGIDY